MACNGRDGRAAGLLWPPWVACVVGGAVVVAALSISRRGDATPNCTRAGFQRSRPGGRHVHLLTSRSNSGLRTRLRPSPIASRWPWLDDLLEDIFLRLDDAADLARASTCRTSFHGIISGRRYQSLHPPPVLGFLDCILVIDPEPADTTDTLICALYHAETSQAASQLARAADFTFPFLPDLQSWSVVDFRDGRVLLSGHADNNCRSIFEDLVIYDPLHRRHVQLPAIPRESKRHRGGVTDVEAFLDPVTDEEKEKDEGRLPFRVICNVYTKDKIWAYIFSSATGRWRVLTNADFAIAEEAYHRFGSPWFTRRHYACGCFFWTTHNPTFMLVLEKKSNNDMKFSIVKLPDEFYGRSPFTLVDSAKGRLGILLLNHDEQMLHLYSKSMQDGVAIGEWRRDISTSNPLLTGYLVMSFSAGGAAEGYILIRAILLDQFDLLDLSREEKPDAHYFTLEVRTLRLERLCVQKFKTRDNFPYASFPPPLSLPSIRTMNNNPSLFSSQVG